MNANEREWGQKGFRPEEAGRMEQGVVGASIQPGEASGFIESITLLFSASRVVVSDGR